MNSLFHLFTSLIKSAIRIVGAIIAICRGSIGALAIAILAAEILGIVEELGDKR